MKRTRQFLSLFLALAILFTMLPTAAFAVEVEPGEAATEVQEESTEPPTEEPSEPETEAPAEEPTEPETEAPEERTETPADEITEVMEEEESVTSEVYMSGDNLLSLDVGSSFTFLEYKYAGESLEWIVLEKNVNHILAITKYVIGVDTQSLHSYVSWIEGDGYDWGLRYLSMKEAEKYGVVQCAPTPSAVAKGLFVHSDGFSDWCCGLKDHYLYPTAWHDGTTSWWGPGSMVPVVKLGYRPALEIRFLEQPTIVPTEQPTSEINLNLSFWKNYEASSNTATGQITSLTCAYGSFAWDNNGKNYDKMYLKVSYSSTKALSGISITLQAPEGFSFSPYEVVRTSPAKTVSSTGSQEQSYCVAVYPLYSTSYSNGGTASFSASVSPPANTTVNATPASLSITKLSTAGKIELRNSFHDKDTSRNLTYQLEADFSAFGSASNQYNHNLCKMGAALSVGSYQIKTVIDDMINLGFSNISIENYNVTDDQVTVNRDQVAVAFGTKKYVTNNQVYTIVAVVIRGTVGAEWHSNFDMNTSLSYHKGFRSAETFVLGELSNYITTLQNSGLDKIHTKMLITGHSRGAAVADMLTVDLNRNSQYASTGNLYTYTFATPHSFRSEREFAGVYTDNIYNLCNVQDVVAHIPGDYIVPGNTFWFNNHADDDYYSKYFPFMRRFSSFTGEEYLDWGSSTTSLINLCWEKWSVARLLSTTVGNLSFGDIIAKMMLREPNSFEEETWWKILCRIASVRPMARIWSNHAMETYIVWLDVLQGNLTADQSALYRCKGKVLIDCPVDVSMYDSNGTLVSKIVNNQVVTANGPLCGVEGDLKYFFLGSDSYRFEIVGNDAGTMDVMVEHYDGSLNVSSRQVYQELPVTDGVGSTLNFTASSASLKDSDGKTITPDYDLDADDIDSLEIQVTVTGDGFVLGDGSYSLGDKVVLFAEAEDGSAFDGWYSDGQLLSSEAGYSFVCTASRTIEARFVETGSGSSTPTSGDVGTWSWSYDTQTDTLTISGTGKMDDYLETNGNFWVNTTPWKDKRNQITYVRIQPGVTSIGAFAFVGLENLTGISIPDTITSIGVCAFQKSYRLSSVTIPNGVKDIGGGAFWYCTGLSNVTIPNSVTSIGNRAFEGCSALTGITIPGSVSSINPCAFSFCTGLNSITIPNSVTTIGSQAFYGCTGLKSITIPNSVTTIESQAFYGCTGLSKITFPDSVTSIGKYAFNGCTGLTSVTLPNRLTRIEYQTFYECTGLTTVTIPESITDIEGMAFYGCDKLTLKVVPGSYGEKYAKMLNIPYKYTTGSQSLSTAVISVANQTYTGKALNPALKVVLNGTTLTEGQDYQVSYQNNTNAGKATVTVKGIGNYSGTTTSTFQIQKSGIAPKVTMTGWTYGKSTKNPTVTGNTGNGKVTYTYAKKGSTTFSATKPTVPGTYTVKASIAETANYQGGTATANFIIAKATQTVKATKSSATIELGKSVTITGKGQGKITYQSANTKIATVTSKGVIKAIKPGTAKITIKAAGNGNYKAGTKVVTIKVVCPKPTISKVTNSKSKTMTVSWGKKAGVTGYQIQYSLKKNFSGAKTVTVKGAGTTSKAIGSLAKGKTYYIRIRTYYGNTKTVSAWSATKTAKISK